MDLTQVQKEKFAEEGYTVCPDFFTQREVRAMKAELQRLLNDGLLRNVRTDGDGESSSQDKANMQICPCFDKSDLFRSLPFSPKIVETVSALIGDPHLFWLDQIFLKPAKIGAGTNWHQDNAYFKLADPSKGTGMWIALDDANVANGTMSIIPGSFRESYPHHRDPFSDHHITCDPPEERAIPIEVAAGGVLFFNYGTAHRTGDNKSDHDRAGLALHFVREDHLPEGNKKHNQPALSGPSADGGVACFGTKVDGTWTAQMDRVLATA